MSSLTHFRATSVEENYVTFLLSLVTFWNSCAIEQLTLSTCGEHNVKLGLRTCDLGRVAEKLRN